jgi:hypothetical protein
MATSVSRRLNTLYIKVGTRCSFKNAAGLYVRVGILLICGKHFDDFIFPLTHIYMTVHFPGVVHELQLKMAGLTLFYGSEHPLLVKR